MQHIELRSGRLHATLKCRSTIQLFVLILITGFPVLTIAAEPVNPGHVSTEPATSTRALLVPVTESKLSSQMTGRIINISVKEGDRFSKDQVLIEFDCGMQKAQLEKALANLNAAKSTHESNLRLHEFKSIGQLELDLSIAEVNKSNADVSMVKAEVSHCSVTAPYDGRVAKLHVYTHYSVAVNQPLIEILDDRILEIRMYAPAAWLGWINTGTAFQLYVDETGKTYTAKVARLGARVDPTSHSFDIVGVLESGQEGLLAGMSGTATFNRPDGNM